MSETRFVAPIAWIAHEESSRQILETAQKVASAATTLLITGESGSGKDHLARLIHELGARHDAPFLKIDCASLPHELVESELFGHERGAFTGAVERKLGRLEMAYGGTIVLDEVAALTPAIQSKLMRVLEERTFERLGGNETLQLDARLIALTNADLPQLIAASAFREDLYFRLNVVNIALPPLRERRADILPLAENLLSRLAPLHARNAIAFADDARHSLESYAWPGNIRELKNVIERALVFGKGDTITAADLPENVRVSSSSHSASARLQSLEDVERQVIVATLEATHYKITKAAEILGISRKTLLDKRKRYGLISTQPPS
ncbi:MAG TPA: sigma-54 dependent transcriptional regulator [Candidatus Acidoferrales bacterium]|nr:sigma-54 dependent transcriptional regulator [Candidatus Acidoferrales bacterium]